MSTPDEYARFGDLTGSSLRRSGSETAARPSLVDDAHSHS